MKTILSLVIALIFYTLTDIYIWQRIFETDQLWQYAGVYHRGWYFSLYGMIALGVLLLDGWRNKIFYGVSLYLLAFNGTNDILYYWLDGRVLPERLEWLDNHFLILFSPVTDTSLLFSSIIWFMLLVLFHLAIYNFNRFFAFFTDHDFRVTWNI